MWLLESAVRKALEQAQKAGVTPSVEQQQQFEASRYSAEQAIGSRILTLAGRSAEVSIRGVITKTPSFLAMLFGGGNTTYPEIIAALAEAERDDNVEDITLAIDSPGGHFDGLFDTLAAIQSTSKPVKAVISNLGASAAYAIASQADEIIASNRAARIGSVGVVATFYNDENEISITSTNAPKKRPDITTEEGKAMVREELDAMHEIFVDAIAEGRSATVEKVNAEFGQGATLLAGEALKRGMIDAIAEPTLKAVKSTKSTTTARSGGNNPEIGPMDLKILKAQHPDVYAAAVQEGADQERDRVTAHLIMGEKSGAMETASKAIKDGEPMTATLQATYLTAGMNRSDVSTRQEEDAAASAADNANASDNGADASDNVASLVEARLGVTGE
jgi:ClpP class serine protease